jgi:hypothetical protein
VKNYERAKELLGQLGTPAKRPKHTPEQPPNIGICNRCGATGIVWANAPSGARIPLDVHPEGDLVLVAGNAISFGPAHEGSRRFVTHFKVCRESQAKRGQQ